MIANTALTLSAIIASVPKVPTFTIALKAFTRWVTGLIFANALIGAGNVSGDTIAFDKNPSNMEISIDTPEIVPDDFTRIPTRAKIQLTHQQAKNTIKHAGIRYTNPADGRHPITIPVPSEKIAAIT